MPMRWLRTLTACAAVAAAGMAPATAVGSTAAAAPATTAPIPGAAPAAPMAAAAKIPARGPFVTLLFSRSEMTAADNCVPDNTGIAPLGTTVAPFLYSLGMSGTGTLVTDKTGQTTRYCTHRNGSLTASWADATGLADNFGWSFVSHTATYPHDWSNLTPAQLQAETCGSADTIASHGLPGAHGLIAYPGAAGLPTQVQADYSANCFAWGRRFTKTGTTPESAGTTPPYWQHTEAVSGGACNVPTAPCYTVQSPGNFRYITPDQIIAQVDALRPGQWFTLQAYILVTGTNPPYASNTTRWDCRSPDPKLHWSNDTERYCYSDWKKIIRAIAARPDITVTDPLTVGVAFGRPATYSDAQPRG
jgi:hypothetical protein